MEALLPSYTPVLHVCIMMTEGYIQALCFPEMWVKRCVEGHVVGEWGEVVDVYSIEDWVLYWVGRGMVAVMA